MPRFLVAYCLLLLFLLTVTSQRNNLNTLINSFYRNNLNSLHDGATGSSPQFLRNIFSSHNFSLSIPQLQRSLVYQGTGHHLRRVLSKIHSGERAVRITVFGGSIAGGGGASIRGQTDWVSRLQSWLSATFPLANVQVLNRAVHGNPSPFANACFKNLAGNEGSDLYILEYTANDGAGEPIATSAKARVFERLMRKAMSYGDQPGIIMLQNMHQGIITNLEPFHNTMEDGYISLAQYYDQPSLSMRDAIYHDMLNDYITTARDPVLHQSIFSLALSSAKMNISEIYSSDNVHPTDLGHSFLLDMIVWLFQQTALGMLLLPHSPSDRSVYPLPPPMYKGNYEESINTCLYNEALREIVWEERSKGWSFVDEGKKGVKKTGYVSTTVGSSLFIKVNTSQVVIKSLEPKPSYGAGEAGVTISYLRSYEHMGKAVIRCESGCVCSEEVVNAHIKGKTSQPYMYTLVVPASDDCIISITILPTTDSGEHKFKVTAVMMQERSVNPIGNDIHGGTEETIAFTLAPNGLGR